MREKVFATQTIFALRRTLWSFDAVSTAKIHIYYDNFRFSKVPPGVYFGIIYCNTWLAGLVYIYLLTWYSYYIPYVCIMQDLHL